MSDEVYYRKKEVFDQYKGGHDRLTICGLESLVRKNNPKRGKSILAIVPRLYAAYDRNQDRVISFEEYLLIETVFASEDLEAAVGLMFDVIDIDKSGYLDREELKAIIKILYKSMLIRLLTEEELVDQLVQVQINFCAKNTYLMMVKNLLLHRNWTKMATGRYPSRSIWTPFKRTPSV